MKVLAGAGVALLMIAACTPEPESRAPENAQANMAEPVTPANDAAPVEPEVAKPLLNLAPDGLALVDSKTGASRQIGFGTPQFETTELLKPALGNFTGQAENPECGAGPLTSFDYTGGLTLFFQDKKFAGWDFDGEGKFTTANGIGIGTSRAALESSGTVAMVPESSIGHEFTAGALSGLLDAPRGKVTNLWAGTTCIFR